jgi:hypothetical protein
VALLKCGCDINGTDVLKAYAAVVRAAAPTDMAEDLVEAAMQSSTATSGRSGDLVQQ